MTKTTKITAASNRTARDIALEGLSPAQQLKIRKLADQHNIPDDDPVYWLGHLLKDDRTREQLSQGFTLMAEHLETFTERLTRIEGLLATAQFEQEDPQDDTEASLTSKQKRLGLLATVSTVFGLTGFMLGGLVQPPATDTPSMAISQTVAAVEAEATESNQTELAAGAINRLLDPHLLKANQDRVERCLRDGNPKCTLLLQTEN